MINKFATVYAGHIDFPDHGQNATPANERRFDNEELAGVYDKTEAIAKTMDALGYDTLWLAEHHFQHEGYEGLPNILMCAVHLAHVTKQLQDRLRLQHRADVAPAAPGRGFRHRRHPDQGPHRVRRRARLSHPRGRDLRRADARPERQPRTVRGAGRDHLQGVQQRVASRTRASTTPCRREVPYRGYQLKELTLVPRPVNRPVECWQPIVSANPRGLDFMVKHGIKGAVGGGAATMQAGPDPGLPATPPRAPART